MKKIFAVLLAGISVSGLMAQNSPYISKVYEYMPAPGQFVNELPEYMTGDSKSDVLQKVEEQICGDKNPGMITLGAFGGYVVFGFDHPIVNVADSRDFKIYGNAFMAASSSAGGSCEPGIVMVSVDVNSNGLADDEWYELAGSDYLKESTKKNYKITYYKPSVDKEADPDPNYKFITDRSYIRYTTNSEDEPEGYVMKNSFHSQSYWPEWYEGDIMEFVGTKLANNGADQSGNGSYYVLNYLEWGYADNLPNDTDEGFDIAWAVDNNGKSVALTHIDFVKVYTAVNQYCGWIGETSTEICGAEDLHPDAEVVSVNRVEKTKDVILMASNSLHVVLRNGGDTVSCIIFSMNGEVAKTVALDNGDNYVDVSMLPQGVYVLKTDADVIKFVK